MFLIFPLIEGMGWMIFSTVEYGYSFWPLLGYPFHFLLVSVLILLTVVIFSGYADRFVNRPRMIHCGDYVTGFALFYLTISLVRIAPGYTNPHYSIRDTSRDIGKLLSGSAAIVTVKGETLFNENNLRYKSFWNPVEKPEILVIAFRLEQNRDILKREYHLLKSYQLYVAPEYLRTHQNSAAGLPERVTVSVYKNGNVRQ